MENLKKKIALILVGMVIGIGLILGFYKPQPEIITKTEYKEKIVYKTVENKNVTKKTKKTTKPDGVIEEVTEEVDLSSIKSQAEIDSYLNQQQIISPKKRNGLDLLYLPKNIGGAIFYDVRIFDSNVFLKGGIIVPAIPRGGVDGAIGVRYEF